MRRPKEAEKESNTGYRAIGQSGNKAQKGGLRRHATRLAHLWRQSAAIEQGIVLVRIWPCHRGSTTTSFLSLPATAAASAPGSGSVLSPTFRHNRLDGLTDTLDKTEQTPRPGPTRISGSLLVVSLLVCRGH